MVGANRWRHATAEVTGGLVLTDAHVVVDGARPLREEAAAMQYCQPHSLAQERLSTACHGMSMGRNAL